MYRISSTELESFVVAVLRQLGCSGDDASAAASVLVWASLRGVDTHGVRNLVPYYVEKIRDGTISATAVPHVETETVTSARLNGNSGLGLANATMGMRTAIDKAACNGVGMVAIHNTHHLGPAGYYAQMAISEGMLGVCVTGHFFGKGNEVGVAPVNGRTAMFSTNPLSFAAPCGKLPDFILDMSTAVATVNRIEMLGQAGQVIPDGWAKNSDALPTTDAESARILYPLGGAKLMGGHKGIGLSMMVSILSGVLTGGWSQLVDAKEYDQCTMGHFMAAVRIDQFMPVDQFTEAMAAMLTAVQACPREDPELEILYPGYEESMTAERRRNEGIPIDNRLAVELQDLADSLALEHPRLRRRSSE